MDQSLLSNADSGDPEIVPQDVTEFNNLVTKAFTSALQGSANLSNMLPTGTVLFFQILNPILLKVGSCTNKHLSAFFLMLCSLVCFLITFTDTFQASNGRIYYGLATFKGLWTPQLRNLPSSTDLSSYRIKAADFVHAFLAVAAFLTSSTFSSHVVSCFFSVPEPVTKIAPVAAGFVISFVFVVFPTSRHGVGCPLTPTTPTTTAATTSAS